MAEKHPTFMGDFRRFFGKGLAILLPSVLTLWIVVQAYLFVDRQVAEPINRGIRQMIMFSLDKFTTNPKDQPDWYIVTDEDLVKRQAALAADGVKLQKDVLRKRVRSQKFKEFWNAHWYFRFIGLLVAIILIYLAGLLLGGFLGRQAYVRVERFLTRVPVFKQVYPHVKQVVDLVLGDRPQAFRRVVLVEYPRKGIWTVGLVTSDSLRAAHAAAGCDMVCIFIPSTPTPFTGFTINVAREETVEVPISVDEAIRYFITGGVLIPDSQRTDIRQPLEPLPSTYLPEHGPVPDGE